MVVGVGTGGTITGTARYLKEQKPSIMIVGADPEGSLFSAPEGDEARPYLTEGIGEDFWPQTFDPSVVDRWVRVSDRDSLLTARAITRQEGILVGRSEEHTSELQSQFHLVCRLLLEKKKHKTKHAR